MLELAFSYPSLLSINMLDSMLTSMEASASNLRRPSYSEKNIVHEKNLYIAPPSTCIPWYVKENRYIPLYMVVLGLYMVLYGYIWYIAPLWLGMA
tara:strand:+ start:290 stop:574 length:285 start_codon:yes stop_codon:yes gene_type:complete